MKKIITLLLVISASFANAQAFKGKGDTKFQVGATVQEKAAGIATTIDFGVRTSLMVLQFLIC